MFSQSVSNSQQHKALYFWLRFIRDVRWGRGQKRYLLGLFKTPEQIYQQPAAALVKHLNNYGSRKIKQTTFGDVNTSLLESDIAWMKREGVSLITEESPYYPEQLAQIDDAPLALFVKGNPELLSEPQVAMVGSRRPSPVGKKLASDISAGLAKLGLVVTSGMALGVDGLCHQGALDEQGATIAVLGAGLDMIYPARHAKLHQLIGQHGVLVSEYPPGTKPARYHFPERNRIVSGLSLGVVIIEAAMRSGTLVTARLALEQNKEVMVLPGSAVSSQYEGSHFLLRDGAALVTCVDDVLHTLSQQLDKYTNLEVNKAEQSSVKLPENRGLECHPILSLIGAEPVSLDEIIMSSGLTPAQVSSMLLELELNGQVAFDDQGGYINLV